MAYGRIGCKALYATDQKSPTEKFVIAVCSSRSLNLFAFSCGAILGTYHNLLILNVFLLI